jgi:hypothetical protein
MTVTLPRGFKFLLIADGSLESRPAAWFAARAASRVGAQVTILAVIEPHGFEHWLGVEEEIRREARETAESELLALADELKAGGVEDVEFIIREGELKTELIQVIEEDLDIRGLILGAAATGDPGPLVSALARGSIFGQRVVPVVVVPGSLDRAEIEEIA